MAVALNRSATLARLDRATQSYHADADAPWLALLAPNVHDRAYINQLAVTYGFEAPLESALAYTDGLADVIALRTRFRAGLIAQDLLSMGVAPAKLSCLPHASITPFTEIAEAFGWMYVVERATHLHDEVRRSVARRLPHAARATSFLCAAGSAATVRWQTFGSALDRVARTPVMTTRIVDAATEAFRYWVEWVEWTQHRFVAKNCDEHLAYAWHGELPLSGQASPTRYASIVTTPSLFAPDAELAGTRLLVVDDEPDVLELLQELLAMFGATVVVAASADDAFKRIEQNAPDVLISDVQMPGGSGLDLVRRLRALPPTQGGRIPAIALSGVSHAAETREAGFDLLVAKPVRVQVLVDTIRSFVLKADTTGLLR